MSSKENGSEAAINNHSAESKDFFFTGGWTNDIHCCFKKLNKMDGVSSEYISATESVKQDFKNQSINEPGQAQVIMCKRRKDYFSPL